MKNQKKFDKKLLVNIAKGTTAYTVLTLGCALPMLLSSKSPATDYLLGCMATGFVGPLALAASSRKMKSMKELGKCYVNAFDRVANLIKPNTKTR